VVDVFEEVEGEMRADRYRRLAKRLLPWAIALAAAVLVAMAAIWGYGQWRQRQSAEASELYGQALTAFQSQNQAESERLFRAASEAGSPAYRSLALQQLAGFRVNADRPREALPLLEQAAEAAPNELLGDAARLKAAFIAMDFAPLAEVEQRLTPLMEEGRPYRLAAREALAMARAANGQTQQARRDFLAISQALDAPEQAQTRARAMIAAIDSGAVTQIPAVLRAAPAPAAAPAGSAALGAAPSAPGAPPLAGSAAPPAPAASAQPAPVPSPAP
jgi:hypothetical protein